MHEQNGNEARIQFMNIDAGTRRELGEFWKVVLPQLPDILSGFYAHVAAVPALAKLVGQETPRLKKAQQSHWERLFSGRFDEAYFNGVRTIGLIHNKIGLEPRWYIGGCGGGGRGAVQLGCRNFPPSRAVVKHGQRCRCRGAAHQQYREGTGGKRRENQHDRSAYQ